MSRTVQVAVFGYLGALIVAVAVALTLCGAFGPAALCLGLALIAGLRTYGARRLA